MSDRVIDLLNQARSRELKAIIQYMAQHYELENQGIGKLAAKVKEISIMEMKHAEKLAERILFLKGQPTYQPAAPAKTGEAIGSMLQTNIGLEQEAVNMYNDAAAVCAEQRDNGSKQVFEELLADEEDHLNYFQNTLDHVNKLGNAYLSTLID